MHTCSYDVHKTPKNVKFVAPWSGVQALTEALCLKDQINGPWVGGSGSKAGPICSIGECKSSLHLQ